MQVKCAMLCSTTAQCLLFLTVYKGLYGTLYCSVHSHSYKMVCKLKQFVSVHIMKAYQGVMAQLHPFLTLAFGGGEWLAKCPRHTLRLQKWFLHRVQSSVSSFNFHYPLASLRLSSSCLRLLPPLPIPSNFHSIFLSITRFIRQFLCKMWPIQSAFHILTIQSNLYIFLWLKLLQIFVFQGMCVKNKQRDMEKMMNIKFLQTVSPQLEHWVKDDLERLSWQK